MSILETESPDPNLYLGLRGDKFNRLIADLLSAGNLKPKYINLLTNKESMKEYDKAFTSASRIHPEDNYERFEQIGDVAASHFIISYFYRRLPQIDCALGVKVVARLRINYGAKKTFSKFAEELGFWPFITGLIEPEDPKIKQNKKFRSRHMKDLLEDVFEAFFGCTEFLLDKHFRHGVGYAIVYDILSSIFNKITVSLAYEDLVDHKTQLKETFDVPTIGAELGTLVYIHSGGESSELSKHTPHVCHIYRSPPGVDPDPRRYNPNWILISTAQAGSKSESEQRAAAIGVQKLKEGITVGRVIKKYYKPPPPEYQFFCAF
jgi:hypothetical protein